MKISVRVKGDWFTVPVNLPDQQTLAWLGAEALNKYFKLRSNVTGNNKNNIKNETVYEIRKAKGGSLLDPEDFIGEVLDDNDFICVGMICSCIFLSLFFDNFYTFYC